MSDKFDWFLTEEFNNLKFSHRKNFSPLLPPEDSQTVEEGNFSCGGINNIMYEKGFVLNSIIPRTSNNSTNMKNKTHLIKCPKCNFKNIHQETIEHHIKWAHMKSE